MFTKNTYSKRGFSLLELMIVIAIMIILASIAVPRFSTFMAKAKRAEVYMYLHALYAAQKIYWATHGTYSSQLTGKNGIGWTPEGYRGGGESENFYYTYGFAGSEGINYVSGKLGNASEYLGQAYAGKEGFLAIAAADVDGDGQPDIISIDHNNTISIIKDDLA